MDAPGNPDDKKVAFTFKFEKGNEGSKTKLVEVVIGPSIGANNDIFEVYTEGTTVKQSSPLIVCALTRSESNSNLFQQKVELFQKSYQFLFRIEDTEGNKSFCVAENHNVTKLISGRQVNYIELQETVLSKKQGKDGKIISHQSSSVFIDCIF